MEKGLDSKSDLMDLFPLIALALRLTIPEELEQVDQEDWLAKELERIDGKKIDVLYLYGLPWQLDSLTQWLEKSRARRIVVFEERLEILRLFFKKQSLEKVFDTRIELCYIPPKSNPKSYLEGYAKKFITDRVELICSPTYKKRKHLRLHLLRRSTALHALMADALSYHALVENILLNANFWKECSLVNEWRQAFSGTPAIICGAGPSLQQSLPFLKQAEHSALIFAGGSAITALGSHGIRAHMNIALDPNEEEYDRLKASSLFEEPFIFSSRLHKSILPSINGSLGYLFSDTGGSLENYLALNLKTNVEAIGPELGFEALSVTTLSLALAVAFGCYPILFCGVDLAYYGMERYCVGVTASSEVFLDEFSSMSVARDQLIAKKNLLGQKIYTLTKWVMEADCLGNYLQQFPKIAAFNGSNTGLAIPGVEFKPIQQFLEESRMQFDLRGKVHCLFENTKMRGLNIEQILVGLSQDLAIAIDILETMKQVLEETKRCDIGKIALLEMDLLDNKAYQVFLYTSACAYQKLFSWLGNDEDLITFKLSSIQFSLELAHKIARLQK